MYYNNSYIPYQAQAQPQNSIIWVQGEAGAKSYLVGAGNSVLLMDSEDSTFYIKSSDASGMPMPLRIFDYKERKQDGLTQPAAAVDTSMFVTKDEFNKAISELKEKKNESTLQSSGE